MRRSLVVSAVCKFDERHTHSRQLSLLWAWVGLVGLPSLSVGVPLRVSLQRGSLPLMVMWCGEFVDIAYSVLVRTFVGGKCWPNTEPHEIPSWDTTRQTVAMPDQICLMMKRVLRWSDLPFFRKTRYTGVLIVEIMEFDFTLSNIDVSGFLQHNITLKIY